MIKIQLAKQPRRLTWRRFRHCYRYRLWLEEEELEEEEKGKEEESNGHNKEKPEEIHKQKPIIVN